MPHLLSRLSTHAHRPLAFAVVGALACYASGCGSGGGLEKVKLGGVVTLDGEPIPNGEILFYPIEGTPGSVSGGPIKDGAYAAEGRGGVPVGKHRVEIRAFRPSSRPLSGDLAIEGGPAVQYLAASYNTQSQLKIEVSSDDETKDFILTSD